jgi:hypothetical protein
MLQSIAGQGRSAKIFKYRNQMNEAADGLQRWWPEAFEELVAARGGPGV